jgi:ADP-ribosyl-[dinitrogen reductase] hydrolase
LAVVGGLAVATVGAGGIPAEWVGGLCEWPRSVAWMRKLAGRLADQVPAHGGSAGRGPLPLFWPGLIPRNLFFLAIVLVHAFRRLLPPS